VAIGNTLGRTPSRSAYSGLQNHQLGNGITPARRACASSRHRDARVAIGAWLSALMDACSASNWRSLDWTILRYIAHSNGWSFVPHKHCRDRTTYEAGGHSVLEKDPVGCALMSGLSRGACRWPSWVCAYVSGTNLSGGLEAHGC
jgi:hypothetical protein